MGKIKPNLDHEGLLSLPVRGFRGLVLTGVLGLLSWHLVKLCIEHGRFPADKPLRKNHVVWGHPLSIFQYIHYKSSSSDQSIINIWIAELLSFFLPFQM